MQNFELAKKKLRNELKNKKRREARLRDQGDNHFLRLVVMAVYMLSGENLDLAVTCWQHRRKHPCCAGEDTSRDRGTTVVRAWVTDVAEDVWDALRERESSECAKARHAAKSFLADAHAAVWALRNNTSKGHAPTTRQVRAERERAASALDLQPSEPEAGEGAEVTVRKWGQRWRAAWAFRLGKLRGRERHDVEQLREKARLLVSADPISVSKSGSKNEAGKRPQK